MKNTVLMLKTFSLGLILSTAVFAAPRYGNEAHLLGIQLGHVSGVYFSSNTEGPDILSGTIGVSNKDLALQVQLSKLYPFQDVINLSWYYGFLGEFVASDTAQIGIGIPFGLMYKMSEGPRLSADIAPVISAGNDVSVSIESEVRIAIPF